MASTNENKDIENTKTEKDIKFILPNQFESDRLFVKPYTQPAKNKSFMTSKYGTSLFPLYTYDDSDLNVPLTKRKGEPLVFVTEIKMVNGCIPLRGQPGSTFETDGSRELVFIPNDKKQQNCKELFAFLQKIDDKYDREINVLKNVDTITKLVGKTPTPIKPLVYKRMIYPAKATDSNYETYDSVIFKFETEFDSNKDKDAASVITTPLFATDNQEQEPEPINSITDYEKFMTRDCTIRYLVRMSKLFIKKNNEASFTLTMMQIVITEKSDKINKSLKEFAKKNFFASHGAKPAVLTDTTDNVVESKSQQVKHLNTVDSGEESGEDEENSNNVDEEHETKHQSEDEHVENSNEQEDNNDAQSDTQEEEEQEEPVVPEPVKLSKSTTSKSKTPVVETEKPARKSKTATTKVVEEPVQVVTKPVKAKTTRSSNK